MERTLRAIVLLVLMAPAAWADTWPRAQTREVFSESREWFVRVVPGDSLGDTVGFAGSPKGKYARAEFYRRAADRSYQLVTEVTMRNPVAPVDFLVTDRGYLMTFDNWHNRGYGQIVVAYSPAGKTVASYTLKDLFSPDEIRAFTTSASSIQWRNQVVYVRPGQASAQVMLDDKGGALVFEAETGAWQLCGHQGKLFQCRRDNGRRAWGPFEEPSSRK